MRTCFLHVGVPKTGTTTIQGFLQNHRAELSARGLDTPVFPERCLVQGARALAKALRRETDPTSPTTVSWRWLDRHVAATSGDLCISRESLATEFLHKDRVAFARAFFARRGVRLKVVAYVRDTPDFVNSAYTQHAKKMTLPQDFDSWAEPLDPDAHPGFSPWRIFRHVLSDDGVDVIVRSFRSAQGRLLPDFLDAIGHDDVDASGFDDTPHRNASPGPKALAAGLIVAQQLNRRRRPPGFTLPYRRALEAGIAERGWKEKPFYGPTPACAERLAARYDSENDLFARAAWGRRWTDVVPRRPRPQHVFEPAAATPSEIAEVEDLAREVLERGDAVQRPLRRAILAAAQPFARVRPPAKPRWRGPA